MENFNEIYDKANELMVSALNKYRNGDFEGGNSDRQKANELFDLAEQEMNTDMYKNTMLYGENKNFGIIYKVIEENAKNLYKTDNGRKKLGKIIKFIKENKCLKNQFKFYNSFFNNKINNTEKYVNEAMNIVNHYSKKELNIANNKLINLIRNLKLDECIDINENELNFYDSIEFGILNEKKLDNLNDFLKHETIIKNFIENNKEENNELNENTISDEIINNIDKLNSDEIEFITYFSELKEGREEKFNEYKKNLLEKIDTEISKADDENINGWKNIHERISHKNYNKNKFVSDIAEMIDIENQLY